MSLSLSVCLVKKLLLTLELGVVKKQTIIKLLKFQIVILKNNNSKKIYINNYLFTFLWGEKILLQNAGYIFHSELLLKWFRLCLH